MRSRRTLSGQRFARPRSPVQVEAARCSGPGSTGASGLRPRKSDDLSDSEIVCAVRAAWPAATAALRLTQQYRHLHSGAEHGSHTRCHRHGNYPPERYAQRTSKKRRAAHGRGGSAEQGQEDNRRRYDPIEQALLRRQ